MYRYRAGVMGNWTVVEQGLNLQARQIILATRIQPGFGEAPRLAARTVLIRI
jgi:hypothetical protein